MLTEIRREYFRSIWDPVMTFVVVCGVICSMGFAIILWIVAVLNMLSFSYLGFMVGDLLFEDQLYVFGVWLVFAVFTIYVAYLMDTA